MLRVIVILISVLLVREFSEFHEAIAQPALTEPSPRPGVLPTPIPLDPLDRLLPHRLRDVLEFHPLPSADQILDAGVYQFRCGVDFCVLLSVPDFPQIFGVGGWCWNATAQIVMHYRGVHPTQCEIATKLYGVPCCNAQGYPVGACGVATGGHPSWALAAYNFNSSPIFPPFGNFQDASSMFPLDTLDWNTLRMEIRNDRPYISYVRYWPGWPLHTVVVKGYLRELQVAAAGGAGLGLPLTQSVWVYDPQSNDTEWIDHAYFSQAGTHFGDVYAIGR